MMHSKVQQSLSAQPLLSCLPHLSIDALTIPPCGYTWPYPFHHRSHSIPIYQCSPTQFSLQDYLPVCLLFSISMTTDSLVVPHFDLFVNCSVVACNLLDISNKHHHHCLWHSAQNSMLNMTLWTSFWSSKCPVHIILLLSVTSKYIIKTQLRTDFSQTFYWSTSYPFVQTHNNYPSVTESSGHIQMHLTCFMPLRDVCHTVTVTAIIYMVANGFSVDHIHTISSTSLSHTVWAVEKTAIADKVTVY
jgi:hypothetical protein